MKIAKYILLVIIVTACVTQKQRDLILKDCPISSFKKDTVWITKKERVDTIYKTVQGPTQYLPNPCKALCDSFGNLKPFKQVSKKNGMTQTLQSVGNVLVQECHDDSLLSIIKNNEITIHQLEQSHTEVHSDCKLEHITPFDNFFIITGKGLWIILVLIAGGWAVKKFILKK